MYIHAPATHKKGWYGAVMLPKARSPAALNNSGKDMRAALALTGFWSSKNSLQACIDQEMVIQTARNLDEPLTHV